MRSVSLSLGTSCPHCRHHVAINAVAAETVCSQCQKKVELDEKFWESILTDVGEAGCDWVERGSMSFSIGDGVHEKTSGAVGWDRLQCPACAAVQVLQDPEGAANAGHLVCWRCSAKMPMRPASAEPALAKAPETLRYLIGEAEGRIAAGISGLAVDASDRHDDASAGSRRAPGRNGALGRG